MIEPDPRTFARLSGLYADRRDVRCVRVALSNKSGFARMNFTEGPPGTKLEDQWMYAQVNTFSAPFAEYYKRDYNYVYRSRWVRIVQLSRILKRHKAPGDIGFMSIDCEGEDVKIVESMDFSFYRPKLLCIEADENSVGQFSQLLEPQGYRFHARTAANAFFLASSGPPSIY